SRAAPACPRGGRRGTRGAAWPRPLCGRIQTGRLAAAMGFAGSGAVGVAVRAGSYQTRAARRPGSRRGRWEWSSRSRVPAGYTRWFPGRHRTGVTPVTKPVVLVAEELASTALSVLAHDFDLRY